MNREKTLHFARFSKIGFGASGHFSQGCPTAASSGAEYAHGIRGIRARQLDVWAPLTASSDPCVGAKARSGAQQIVKFWRLLPIENLYFDVLPAEDLQV